MIRVKIRKIFFATLMIAIAVFAIYPYDTGIFAAESGVNPVAASQSSDVRESGGFFSLARCIEIALARNPEIAAAQWDIAAANSRLDAARAAFWPQVSTEGGYQRYVDSQRLIAARYNGEVGVFDNDLLRGDLVVRWPLFTGWRITSEADAAGKLSEAEKKKFIRTRDELIYSVTSVYFSILGQQKIVAALEFSKGALEESRKRVAQLYDVQKVAKVDLLRTEVRLTDLKQNFIKEENTLAVQERLLFSLMGLDVVPEKAVFDEKLEPTEAPIDLARLIETALKNCPDYQAAKDRTEAQALRVKAAKAGYWPTVSLVGAYGVRNAPSSEDMGKNTKSTEDIGSIGGVVTVPLFDAGLINAKVREETANLAASRERLKKLELQIRQETETAALGVQSNAARIKATEKAIEQAKESFRIESLKYDLARGSITDVLDAQSAQLQAETAYYRALIDYHTSMARLRLATGGNI